jgi:DNA-binding YbaB/EbfC family protein
LTGKIHLRIRPVNTYFQDAENGYRLHLKCRKDTIESTKDEVNIMKFPGGMDLNSMMKQAQQMQEQMGREMKEMVVDASAGGGAVTVKMRGDFEVVELKISPDTIKDGDVEMLQDLTVAALNEAHRKVEESLKGKLGGMLPPGLI